jgi:anaerobic selenocysteine-containing dehydrogenase
VQAESRFSITAGAADRWLPLKPGTELHFITAVGAMLLDAPGAKALPKPVLDTFQAADVKALLDACGLEERRVRPIIAEFAKAERPLLLAGASAVHSNSLEAIAASHYLNVMLGNIGKPGGVLAPVPTQQTESRPIGTSVDGSKAILVEGSNPIYLLPGTAKVFGAAETVISFAPFIDDSAAWADLILPASHYLETEIALVPQLTPKMAVSVGTPFVRTLYDTRPFEQILGQLGDYAPVTAEDMTGDDWDTVRQNGGAWKDAPAARPAAIAGSFEVQSAQFSGDAAQFPLVFQPYMSLQFHEGSGANLPWMQELPDPVSSTMWGLPVEIDGKTAAKLGVENGDRVKIESPHGSINAAVYIHPAAVPGVASMGIGGGHAHYTRYAAGRGANPLSILAATWEKNSGALATGATRVRLTRIGKGELIQYSAKDFEQKDNSER